MGMGGNNGVGGNSNNNNGNQNGNRRPWVISIDKNPILIMKRISKYWIYAKKCQIS
jgi:hypothetical protein